MATAPQIGVMFRREQHPATLIDYARRVESMGFDQIWVVEDCFYHGGVSQAAIALATTSRLKVGLGINPAVARNPAFLAMEYATLANACPGRVVGGIGHGVAEWMEQIGATPASWLTSIEEITTAVRRILRGEEVTTEGRYARLDRVKLELPPTDVPPVVLGVRGDNSLQVAGRCSEGVLVVEGSPPAYVRHAADLFAQGRTEVGLERDGSMVVYAWSTMDEGDPEQSRERARRLIAADNAPIVQPTIRSAGFAEAFTALAANGIDALATGIEDEWLHDLAFCGTSENASGLMHRFTDSGANAVVLVPPADAEFGTWLENQSWATAN